MYTGRYPAGVPWTHDGGGEGPQGPPPRPGRPRAHPQRVPAAVPRAGHQPHRHGPALRGGPGVQAHGLPALHRQGRTRRRVPAPVRPLRSVRRVRPHRPHAPRTAPRRLRHPPTTPCAPTSPPPSNSTTPSTPHLSTHATTRKPSPRGSPTPPAKPAPPTLNSSASSSRCSSTAPRPAPGSSTPTPSPPPPPSPPPSSTTPSPPQPAMTDDGRKCQVNLALRGRAGRAAAPAGTRHQAVNWERQRQHSRRAYGVASRRVPA
jgi:hypothetical protein